MLSAQEVKQFEDAGAVTVDSPLTEQQLAAASAAYDRLLPLAPPGESGQVRYRLGSTCEFYDPELLELIQHPFFEEVAKQVLRAKTVYFYLAAMAMTHPQPDAVWSYDQHTDIQYCLSDLDAVPKRMICSLFVWISDVNEKRAPMVFRPGSHRLIAAEREKDPELKGVTPQVVGTKMDRLPDLPYADPVPIVARAGQVSVLTTGMIHGASLNVDTVPRKALLITFTAEDVEILLPPAQVDLKKAYDLELRQRLRPDRVHIVPE
ncbi:MAG: phytanoyl-CoA dioxygenase family protein [bacterium]|nr:phytanoyl-CoA dioxygenase family protein [bacterium]